VAPPVSSDNAPAGPLSSADATIALSNATKACLARLQATPTYQIAAATAADRLKSLEALRAAGTMDGRLEASSAYNKSEAVVKKMQTDAMASDPSVTLAASALTAARARDAQAVAAEKARQDAANADAAAQAQADADRINNDPTNVAVRKHQLVEGMTYDQAVQSISKPYSISQSGNIVMATWEFGEGNFWSATFVDDVATEVTHSRF
jgi:hypothetical protein